MSTRWKQYENLGLSGLSNMGNTCFMNTTLQCLSHTYELSELLEKPEFQRRIRTGLLSEYNELRKLLWHKNCIVTPGGFLGAVHKQSKKKNRPMFSGYDQNDVSEFVHFLLEAFHEDTARKVKMTVQGTPKTKKDILAKKCLTMMKQMYEKEYSEIVDLFFGIHVSRIVGLDKQVRSASPEPFFTLCLPIPNPVIIGKHMKPVHLLDCFDLYTKHERLDGENQWMNDKTNQKEIVDKGVVFWSLPQILVVELKRYQFRETPRGIQLIKNMIPVQFDPSTELNLLKYVVGYMPHKYKYQLYGVCNHMGTLQGGHYTAYVKNANGKWYQYNDRAVSEIPERDVITAKAYALWFRRVVS